MAGSNKRVSGDFEDFEDIVPVMADKLGGEGLMKELCHGFQLLADKDGGVITLESLKRNSALLGLEGFEEDDYVSMLKEGDLDGDGALKQMEFCVLMFRLSPGLMEESLFLLEDSLEIEKNYGVGRGRTGSSRGSNDKKRRRFG